MRKHFTLTLMSLCALLFGANLASASLSNYVFSVGYSDQYDMGSSTNLWAGSGGSGGVRNQVTSVSLPFTFLFDGTAYSRVSISSQGVLGLGSSDITSSGSNDLTRQNMPVIAPYWDDIRLSGLRFGECGYATIDYATVGSSPNRVFIVQYQDFEAVQIGGAPNRNTMQVRLHEGSNKIEFWYGTMSTCDNCFNYGICYNGSASIGLATGSSNFISVTPNSTDSRADFERPNDNVDLYNDRIDYNLTYTFLPCNVSIAGNRSEGGTDEMASGDRLFDGFQVQRGNTGVYQPFTLSNSTEGCSPRSYTYSITGPAAADYTISESDGTLEVGSSSTPVITFTPSTLGVRSATLTVTDDNGFSRSYPLVAVGTTRIQWIGNLAQGGTASLNSGDTLMKTLIVRRGTTQMFTPVTIRNFNDNGEAPTAPVTFTIVDTSGQFSMIPPSSTALGAGSSFTPQIRFSPIRVGFQQAVLTVTADGETRTFPLKAFGAGPGAEFAVNNTLLGPSAGLFVNTFVCVGEVANTQALMIRSIGSDPFVINSINFYRIDTNYGQGVPRYPLIRDRAGNPVPMRDYFISRQPGTAPIGIGQNLTLPDTIPAGQTRTYYITYVGQETGKRFARAFIRTNGETFLGNTESGQIVEGLLNFELFGRSIGGHLSDNPTTPTLKSMVFDQIRVGDSLDLTYRMYNTGDCDLRVSLEKLMIATGDVQDFRLLSAFGRTIVENVPMTGDAILTPDASATITVRFKPQRNGSRRATLWMQTNDSSTATDGVAERGAYYLDLYGYGKAFLDYTDVKLKPAVIGSGVASRGTVRVVNSSTATVGIASITIVGGDAGQFAADGTWPATPMNLAPGAELNLGIQMIPTGTPGARMTTVRIVTTTGETIDITVTSEAGVQSLAVSPGRLFVGTSVIAGTEARAMVMISNTGTLPIRIASATISGPFATDYRLGTLPRLVLEPGAIEYLEVTYAPVTPGVTSTATLTIVSDAGTQTVSLEGVGVKAGRIDPDPTGVVPGMGITQPEFSLNTGSTSMVREAAAAGIAFEAVRPNPARERAELVFSLARTADVRLELYDGAGRIVREIASGSRTAGEHRVSVDVSNLGAGLYHCRLVVGSIELSQTMIVVK